MDLFNLFALFIEKNKKVHLVRLNACIYQLCLIEGDKMETKNRAYCFMYYVKL